MNSPNEQKILSELSKMEESHKMTPLERNLAVIFSITQITIVLAIWFGICYFTKWYVGLLLWMAVVPETWTLLLRNLFIYIKKSYEPSTKDGGDDQPTAG